MTKCVKIKEILGRNAIQIEPDYVKGKGYVVNVLPVEVRDDGLVGMMIDSAYFHELKPMQFRYMIASRQNKKKLEFAEAEVQNNYLHYAKLYIEDAKKRDIEIEVLE